MTVKLYALSTCPYCRMTRAYLDENDVEYELTEIDHLDGAERDAAVAEIRELSGGPSVPVIVIDGEVIVGFNKKLIKERLGL
jgi:glutaredoxin